ncbi:MAG: gliding motility-associated C-terminal domain-containing protein [Flavobacteriales bacterium]|nr:gliding motility-associated C-terminal domain-containing protein [Flavobacteriales bacterium]
MNRKTLFAIFFCCAVASQAQILNGSFEQFSAIPANMGQWQVVNGWTNAGSLTGSPDFYHYNGSTATDLPETPLAEVQAYQGNAVMGMIACGKFGTNIREYLQTELATPMVVGRKYIVSFRITNGLHTSTSLGGLSVDKIGCLFSVGAVTQTDQTPINQTPQFSLVGSLYTTDWKTVTFAITADQAYTHMTFGLFGNDSDKAINIREGVDPLFAYYFMDSFSMDAIDNNFDHSFGDKVPEPIDPGKPYINPAKDNDSPFFVPNTFTPDGDGYNEQFIPVANTLKEWEFEIFNKWGERVFYTTDESRGWDGNWNGKPCENGSYIWQITYVMSDDKDRPRSMEEQGIVNLVR